ncbi:MAG: tetratricopeptide repeat protein, partial [Bacteroidetes bacterium]|nr:tetratricopeptide repeat protein [Bacteroidota bacterium]
MKQYLFFLILFPATGFAQQSKIDSLKSLIDKSVNDSLKVNLYIDISYEFTRKNPDEAIMYAKQGYDLAGKINFINGMGVCEANIALAYYSKGDYKQAIEHNLTALQLKEKTGDKTAIAYSLNNIALVYDEMHDYKQALSFYKRAEQILRETNNKRGLASVQNNIGEIYYSVGKNDSALYYYNLSLQAMKELNNKNAIGMIYTNFASIYFDKEEYDKAIDYDTRSLQIRKELEDKYSIASSYINLGNDYGAKGEFQKSIEYYNQAIAIARQMEAKEVTANAYLGISDTYYAMKNYASAYNYHKKYSELKDSLLNEESSKQIAEMQTKYETEKKEQQITLLNKDKELQDAQLNRQKMVIWSVAGGLLVVLILSIFIFRERKKSEKLLLNILPVETARELKANGRATAKYYEQVTVMFTDFKGFTNIAEKLSAEELVSELDFLFKKFDEIISKYPIEKIKTIGDAYMCAGGLPTSNTTNAMDVVSAALEIQEWMKSPLLTSPVWGGKKSQVLPNGEDLGGAWQLRIGIHTGPVSAGVVGDKKFAYDIWGD